jgi:nucleoredoxin
MEDLVGTKFVTKTGETTLANVLAENKVVGIYFSAHWCPPCRSFTPVLRDFYNEVNANGKKLEIIFGSLDKSEAEFQSYYGEMPWISIPHGDPKI